jgi:hypothetical protein
MYNFESGARAPMRACELIECVQSQSVPIVYDTGG